MEMETKTQGLLENENEIRPPRERYRSSLKSYTSLEDVAPNLVDEVDPTLIDLNKELYHAQWKSAQRWFKDRDFNRKQIRDVLQVSFIFLFSSFLLFF